MLRGKDCNIGDRVKLLHEKGEGIVKRKTIQYIYVDLGDGFELPLLHNDVILIEKAKKEPVSSESSKKEDNFVETKVEELHIVNKISKTNSEKGIYLVFVPLRQDILLAGDLQVYLINYTPYGFLYSLFLPSLKNYETTFKGEIEPATAKLIDIITRNELAKYSKTIFQLIFTKASEKGVLAPVSVNIEIKPNKFSNEDLYNFNPFIDLYSIDTILLRFDEVVFLSQHFKNMETDNFLNLTSKINEKTSLIDKFATTNKVAEVDLHLDKIVEDVNKIHSSQKIDVQIKFMKQCIDSAIESSYKSVVFIHGVGVGVLKIEIHKVLSSYENIEFRDAPISKYGIGATEVIILQSK